MAAGTKKFAVFDIDGTLIRWQLYHAIADELFAGKPDERKKIEAARAKWKRRTHEESFMEYEKQLVKLYIETMRSLDTEEFTRAVDKVFGEYKDQVYRYTRELLKDLKRKNYLIFAISGSSHEVVAKMAAYYGFDDYIGVKFQHKNGRYTGESTPTWGVKGKLLQEFVVKHGLDFAGSIGVGDSEGDIAMLDLVEQPIAFNPSKKLFHHAHEAGWHIVIERKNMIYELEPHNGSYVLAQAGE